MTKLKYYNTCLPDEVVDITEYVGKYHEELLKNCDEEKLGDELGSFMRDTESWHSTSCVDKETGKYVTVIPLGCNKLPDWLMPRELWYSEKKFSINESMLVVKEGKDNWTIIPLDIDVVGQGLISTEHSVMCSSTSLEMEKGFNQKEAEKNVVKRLLTEVYPHSSFSMVSDSYDYWRLVTEILPKLKDDILERNQENGNSATLFVRGDSGDPVKIVAGYIDVTEYLSEEDIFRLVGSDDLGHIPNAREKLPMLGDSYTSYGDYLYIKYKNKNLRIEYSYGNNCFYLYGEELPDYIVKGTVEVLWDIFGGTVNSKGYKVLDPHIRAIYGDSITQQRQEMIYKILELKGFSVENVALGAGSFSFHAYEKDGVLYPYTRDTMNYCMKNTYAEYSESRSVMVYKDPKTDYENFKRSQRGCCAVYKTETDRNGNYYYYLDHDGLTLEERESDTDIAFEEIFKDGKMVKEVTFKEVREVLNDGKF